LPQKKGAQIARPQRWDARLDVQVLHIQRVFHDELTPRLDILAHERGEDILGLGYIFELHGKQSAKLELTGRLEQGFCARPVATGQVAPDAPVLFS